MDGLCILRWCICGVEAKQHNAASTDNTKCSGQRHDDSDVAGYGARAGRVVTKTQNKRLSDVVVITMRQLRKLGL